MSVKTFSAQENALSITNAALEHIRALMLTGNKGRALRFGVDKSGCSGYMYVLDFIAEPEENDRAFEVAEDMTVYVDKSLLPILHGTRIDYAREGLNSAITFDNPNAQAQCGCGESFSVDSV